VPDSQKLPYDIQRKILELRKKGLSHSQIAKEVGISKSAAGKYCRKQKVVPDDSPPTIPAHNDVGILHNNVNLDGTADIVLPRKFLSPEDLMIACGLDSSRWVCESFTGNTWQSAMGGQPDGKIESRPRPITPASSGPAIGCPMPRTRTA
jgi:hypothetical protein